MQSQLTVRIAGDLERKISCLAEKLRLKRSDIVRMALEKFTREFGSEKKNRPYENMEQLIGSIASGVPNLGEAHREYLLERFKRDA